MQDVAKAVEDAGIQEMMAILKPLADTTSNDEVQEEVNWLNKCNSCRMKDSIFTSYSVSPKH